MRHLLRLTALAFAGLLLTSPPAADGAPRWPVKLRGQMCLDGAACENYGWVLYQSKILRTPEGQGRWGGAVPDELLMFIDVDADGNGVPEGTVDFTGSIDISTGCATGTVEHLNGRSGTFTGCR